MSCEPSYGIVYEDSAFSLLARVQADGANVTQSDVSSITWSCWDVNDASTVVASGALTVASVVFDALQTDGRWATDATGYNFRHDIAATVLTTPGQYRFEHKVTLTGGSIFFLTPFVVQVTGIWTS